jgi:HK97 family phage portal protein
MKLFGFEITRTKAVGPVSPGSYGYDAGWIPVAREPYPGAWQRNVVETRESVVTYHAVYSCVTLIASDIAKIGIMLVEKDGDGIWNETESPAFSPVLRKPNRYQTRIQFFQSWVISRLLSGNTYVLKQRDLRGVVVALYVLDPSRVKVLVAPDGSVYYELKADNLSGLETNSVTVPQSEIIHDVHVPLYHPLCGVSPIVACYAVASQGLAIQSNSTKFFQNGSRPGGVLTAPNTIKEDTARRLKEYWEANFTGENAGRIAVLGDGLKFEALAVKASDSQLVEQLKLTAEVVCSCFHVPPFMIGIGPTPAYNNIEALTLQYYSQALQVIIESIELLLDEGLGLTAVQGKTMGTMMDLDNLLRMDTSTKVKTTVEGLKGIFTPNEARKKFDLKPQDGGDSVYMQQQNFSLAALAKRDEQEDPFGSAAASAPAAAVSEEPEPEEEDDPEDVQASVQLAVWELKSNLARASL